MLDDPGDAMNAECERTFTHVKVYGAVRPLIRWLDAFVIGGPTIDGNYSYIMLGLRPAWPALLVDPKHNQHHIVTACIELRPV